MFPRVYGIGTAFGTVAVPISRLFSETSKAGSSQTVDSLILFAMKLDEESDMRLKTKSDEAAGKTYSP